MIIHFHSVRLKLARVAFKQFYLYSFILEGLVPRKMHREVHILYCRCSWTVNHKTVWTNCLMRNYVTFSSTDSKISSSFKLRKCILIMLWMEFQKHCLMLLFSLIDVFWIDSNKLSLFFPKSQTEELTLLLSDSTGWELFWKAAPLKIYFLSRRLWGSVLSTQSLKNDQNTSSLS